MKNIPIVDSHIHLWDISLMQYPWLEGLPGINRDFLIADYREQTTGFHIEKMVFVQCDCLSGQALKELEFVTAQARLDNRLQAIVAYAPLEQGRQIKDILTKYQANHLVKGVRKMYDEQPSMCVSSNFLDAVSLLPDYQLSFDLSIRPTSIKQTLEMIKECPQTRFVLDHLAKPDIKNGQFDQYQRHIEAFASLPNVVAKISGLITEANLDSWTDGDITPYINHAIDCFGFNRLMYGGDWPVVLLAGTYNRWLEVVFNCVSHHREQDLDKLFRETASRTYRLA